MSNDHSSWLAEDEQDALGREERGKEIQSLFPVPEGGAFILGGLETGLAFNEMQTAYYYGLWLSTILTGTSALERHIGAFLFGRGESAVKEMSFPELMERAEQVGHITDYEKVKFIDPALIVLT